MLHNQEVCEVEDKLSESDKLANIFKVKKNSTILSDGHEINRERQYFNNFMYFSEDFETRCGYSDQAEELIH